jgi:hypothetical protein
MRATASKRTPTALLGLLFILLAACSTARPSSRPATPTTAAGAPRPSSPSLSSTWPTRYVVATGQADDLSPTAQALYWLDSSSVASAQTQALTAALYELTTHRSAVGPVITGVASEEALTVSGGWVWLVVGRATDAVAYQLDPDGLAIHAEVVLAKSGTMTTNEPIPAPVVTATPGGPLWVGAGSGLWALDPSTGATQAHLGVSGRVAWLSTDPGGGFLYVVTGNPAGGGETVTQYDSRTGHLLRSSNQPEAVAAGTAAATSGGVWLSYRSGMAGGAFELSSANFTVLSHSGGFGVLEEMGGVGSAVSDGVLWLTSDKGLTCADPSGGKPRAREAIQVRDPVAHGHVLYAAGDAGILEITPPSSCWSAAAG